MSSSKIQLPSPTEEPSNKETYTTSAEMVQLSPSQRSVAQYEERIRELRGEVCRYRDKCETLRSKLEAELRFRPAYVSIKRGKLECLIQLGFVTLLTGMGAWLMGVYPKAAASTPPQFWIGATLAGVGVLSGITIRPIVLVLCYVWPKWSKLQDD